MTSIRLNVEGLQSVPSFKNNKMLTRGKLITHPKKQKWMEKCEASFASQLRSFFQIRGIAILTEPHQLSSIASYLPLDDSAMWIGELSVNWRSVKKGEEGAVITIERIDEQQTQPPTP